MVLFSIFYWFKFRNIYLEEQKKVLSNKLSVGALFFTLWIACWIAIVGADTFNSALVS